MLFEVLVILFEGEQYGICATKPGTFPVPEDARILVHGRGDTCQTAARRARWTAREEGISLQSNIVQYLTILSEEPSRQQVASAD